MRDFFSFVIVDFRFTALGRYSGLLAPGNPRGFAEVSRPTYARGSLPLIFAWWGRC